MMLLTAGRQPSQLPHLGAGNEWQVPMISSKMGNDRYSGVKYSRAGKIANVGFRRKLPISSSFRNDCEVTWSVDRYAATAC